MGIGDRYKTRTVLTKFDADASGYFREVDKVNSKNKESRGGFLSLGRAMTDGINAGVQKLGELNQAFEGAIKIVEFAREAVKGWAEDLRMEAANAGRSIDALADAAQGLVDDDSLNKFAARAGSGALKLTQQQLETVAQAAVALRERGFEAQEALDMLTDAAVTGRTKGLRPLGLEVDEGNSKFETAKNLMTELNKVIAEGHGPVSQQADDVERLGVAWANAWDNAKNYIAEATVALALDKPMTHAEMLKYAFEHGGDTSFADQAMGLKQVGWTDFRSMFPSTEAYESWAKTQKELAAGIARGRQQIIDSQLIEMPELDMSRSDGERKKMAEEAARRMAQAILDSAVKATDRNVDDVVHKPIGYFAESTGFTGFGNQYQFDSRRADSVSRDEFGRDTERSILDEVNKEHEAAYTEMTTREQRFRASFRNRNESYLESLFGPIEDFDLYKTAFGGLQVATQSAMSAWISGSMSLGTAIKKGLGDALSGLASQLAVEGLKHGAYALGSLAFLDFGGAARHAAAAGAFGLAATAAAVAAKKLGASVTADVNAAKEAEKASAGASGSGGRARSSNGGGGRSGDGSSSQVNNYTIVYGEMFYRQSTWMRQHDAGEFVKTAIGSSYVEHS